MDSSERGSLFPCFSIGGRLNRNLSAVRADRLEIYMSVVL